jgi:WD40 repeat protein
MLASRAHSGTTKLWDATPRHKLRELAESALIAGFSADSSALVVQASNGFELWRPADGKITTIPLSKFKFRGLDSWADVGGTEPYAVFGQPDGTVEYWNLATTSRVASWRVSQAGVSTATISPDGHFIATSDVNGDVKLWQTKARREVRRYPTTGEKLQSVIFSPDGRLLVGLTPGDKPRLLCPSISRSRILNKVDCASRLQKEYGSFRQIKEVLSAPSTGASRQLARIAAPNPFQ